jgi:L-ascorbate metabolism protein UlaG (beta-lactamase superfamily)
LLGFVGGVCSASETETLKTSAGDLKITLVGHGSVMFEFGGKVIHVDPLAKMGDYAKLPQADLILLTHEHGDHLDMNALGYIRAEKTAIVLTQAAAEKVKGGLVMANGDVKTVDGLKIEATPAYNVAHKRDTGEPFHPKGRGNGYVITFGDRRVYVGGDTENIPEMKDLKDIDVAFLPINLPFTMTAAMVTDAAKSFKPKVLIPYHFDMGETDLPKLYELMKDVQGVEARVRTKK